MADPWFRFDPEIERWPFLEAAVFLTLKTNKSEELESFEPEDVERLVRLAERRLVRIVGERNGRTEWIRGVWSSATAISTERPNTNSILSFSDGGPGRDGTYFLMDGASEPHWTRLHVMSADLLAYVEGRGVARDDIPAGAFDPSTGRMSVPRADVEEKVKPRHPKARRGRKEGDGAIDDTKLIDRTFAIHQTDGHGMFKSAEVAVSEYLEGLADADRPATKPESIARRVSDKASKIKDMRRNEAK